MPRSARLAADWHEVAGQTFVGLATGRSALASTLPTPNCPSATQHPRLHSRREPPPAPSAPLVAPQRHPRPARLLLPPEDLLQQLVHPVHHVPHDPPHVIEDAPRVRARGRPGHPSFAPFPPDVACQVAHV